jgi:predicted GNAT family acetyltransferase
MSNSLIRILQPGNEALLQAFLLPRVASSMFLLGNMRQAGLRDSGQAYEGSYAALFEAGRVVGVVAHYWNGNVVFQAPRSVNPLWRAAVGASHRPVSGLIGPAAQVAVAKEALQVPDSGIQLDEREKLYSLDLDELLVPGELSSGQVVGRRIRAEDLDWLSAWRAAYNVEATGATDGPELRERSRDSLQRSLQEGRTWVLERDGQAVACSSFNTAIAEAVQVGGVWTPPQFRRRGYGRCVVAASLLDARAEGAQTAILFTGQENIAAQKAYTALGFRHIGDYRILLLRQPIEVPIQQTDFSGLSRPIHPMPDFVRDALVERGLVEAYRSRPPYQQNDYIGWISRAKRPETRQKRLDQMLDELERGDLYMKMPQRGRSIG